MPCWVVVVLSCLYTVFSPKKIWPSIKRALFPASNVSVATRTQFLNVEPGDAELLAGTQMNVTVDLQGEVPEWVALFYTTADHGLTNERVELRQSEEDFPRYRGVVTGENGRGILQDLTYHIVAGDAKTHDYKVRVNQPPSATVDEIHYVYPKYMNFESKTQQDGHIDAWEGTKIRIVATTNMLIRPRSAKILFFDSDNAVVESDEVEMVVTNGITLHSKKEWTATIRSDGTFPRFYQIECENTKGEADPEPTLYSITIRPDKRPDVVLLDPTSDLTMPANGIVPLMIQASDPDFMLRYVTLKIEKDGQTQIHPSVVIFDGLQKSLDTTFDFHLEPLQLIDGDTITFWIEARDNKQPVYNRRNTSPKLNITIVDHVPTKEVLAQLEQDKQHQQEKLAELRQNRNQSGTEPTEPQETFESETDVNSRQPKTDRHDQNGEKQAPENEKSDQLNGSGSQVKNSEQSESDGLHNDGSDDGEAIRHLYLREQQKQQAKAGQDRSNSKKEGTEKGEKPEQQPEPTGTASQPNESVEDNSDAKQDQGGKDVKDNSRQQGDPSAGSDSPSVTDPASPNKGAGGEQHPENVDGGKTSELPNGKENPADDSSDSMKKKASGDETGTASPGDPQADSTKAKNDIKRKEGTQPTTRPSKDPMAVKKKFQETSGAGKNPNAAKAKPQTKNDHAQKKHLDQRPTAPTMTEPKQSEKKLSDSATDDNDQLNGKTKNQKSDQSQGGDDGKSKGSEQGNSGGKNPGPGDPNMNPGHSRPSSKKTGQSGNSKGQGSNSQDVKKKSGDQSSRKSDQVLKKSSKGGGDKPTGQSQGRKSAGKESDSGSSSSAGGSQKQDGSSTRGGKRDERNFTGGGSSAVPKGEEPNLEFSRKAANLVLTRIEEDLERGEVDQEILKELGWTEDDMKKFATRLQNQLRDAKGDPSPEAKARRRQFEEMLTTLNLRATGSLRTNPGTNKRSVDGIGPRRLPVPVEWLDAWQAYTESLAKWTNARKNKAKKN